MYDLSHQYKTLIFYQGTYAFSFDVIILQYLFHVQGNTAKKKFIVAEYGKCLMYGSVDYRLSSAIHQTSKLMKRFVAELMIHNVRCKLGSDVSQSINLKGILSTI